MDNYSTTDANEDWLRSMHWDLPATTVPELLAILGKSSAPVEEQRQTLLDFMKREAWKPAPESLKIEARIFTSGKQ